MSYRYREERERWEVKWREGGRQRSRLFRFERDARDFDNELYRRKRMGFDLPFDKGQITLNEWATEAWPAYISPSLSEGTRTTYAYQWDKHVLPRLGGMSLRDIDAGVVARFTADLRRAGVGDATIRRVLSILQNVLKHAQIHGHIAANPVAAVGRPKQPSVAWPDPVPPELTERILDAMPTEQDRILVELVAYAGLRPHEALGASVTHLRGSKLQVSTKKVSTVPHRVVDVIEPLRRDLEVFIAGRTSGPIIRMSDGRPFTDATWRNWRRRVWKEHGEPLLDGDKRLYRMRGSFASLLAWEGRPITYVARQLGHSVETCSRYYLGVFEQFEIESRQPAADAVTKARMALAARECVPPTFPTMISKGRVQP